MLYDVRIENEGVGDVLVTGVGEDRLPDTITSLCGRDTTIVVTLDKEGESK